MSADRVCPRCESPVRGAWCCGIHLDAPFRMSARLIAAVRRYAHGRKGLDTDTYRLHLQAVGASSTTLLTRAQYGALMHRLRALPNRERPKGRAATC